MQRYRYANRRGWHFPIADVIDLLVEGKRVAYCCTAQKQYDRAKGEVTEALQREGKDVSLADNFICNLSGTAVGLDNRKQLFPTNPFDL